MGTCTGKCTHMGTGTRIHLQRPLPSGLSFGSFGGHSTARVPSHLCFLVSVPFSEGAADEATAQGEEESLRMRMTPRDSVLWPEAD